MKKRLAILLTTGFLINCSQPNNDSDAAYMEESEFKQIEFLQLKYAEELHMQALVSGNLYTEQDCVKISGHTLIWPNNYSLHFENGFAVIKTDSKIIAKIGDEVTLAGGELDSISHVKMTPPIACIEGPYWLVGEE